MANNPVLSILNPQVKAPTAVPQVGLPTVAGPSAVNLTATPAPQMTPQAPGLPADLPDGTTTSLDLPASLQGLLGDTSPQVTINEQAIAQPQSNTLQQVGTVAANSGAPALDFRLQPTYAEGGMVGANGMPVRPTGAGGVTYYDATGSSITAASMTSGNAYFATFQMPIKDASVVEISANSFPGTYYVTGDTYSRKESNGVDEFFQFIIPKAKVQSENTITLEAEGDPTVNKNSNAVVKIA